MRTHVLDDFSGGTRKAWCSKFAPNQSAELNGFWHVGGTLMSMEGRKCIGQMPIAKNIVSHYWYRGTDQSYCILKSGDALWLGILHRAATTGPVAVNGPVAIADNTAWPQSGQGFLNGIGPITWTSKTGTTALAAEAHGATGDTGATIETLNIVPLAGHCHSTTGTDYIAARTENALEYMTQVNGYAYLSNGGYGPALRWDGFFYCSGTATCTGNATVTINGAIGDTAFADVRQGDQIYLKDHSQGAYGGVWQFGQCATILSRDTVAGTLTLEGNGFATTAKGPGGSNNVDFVIVRVHQMGVAAAPTSSATLGAAGGALAAGTKYYYTFRYKNSHTGYSGNLAAVSNATTDSSKLQITVAGWATRPADRDVNEIEVFRSLDGAVWKRLNCGTTSKNLEADPTTGNFAANLNDNGLALLEEIDTYYAYHDRPASASLGKMRWFNSHLWARGTNTTGNGPHWLYWSTLDNYEYWPTQEFGTDNPASTFPLLGGCMQIGAHAGEYITAIFPEGGNYEYTGNSGTNLLVLTRQKAVRVYGYDWTDFAQLPAFDEGCVYHKSGAVGNGRLFWLSHKGPMMLVAGTNDPVPIYQALWPRGIAEHMYVSPRNTYLAGASGVCWNECYVLTCCTGTNTANSEVYVYHIPTNTWTQMHSDADMAGYNDLQSLAGTPTGSVEMPVDGMDITSTDTNRRVYAMFSKCGQPAASSSYGVNTYRKYAGGVVGITARWLSQPIYIDEGVGNVVGAYKVRAQFRAASTAQTVTLKLYADGDTSSAIWTGAATIPAVTANSNKRVWVEWMPTKRSGKLLQFELSGTFTEQIELERFDTGLIKQGN